jgi:hypothetical protein
MAELPGHLDRRRDLELEGRTSHGWIRRGVLAAMVVVLALALWSFFGQRPTETSASARGVSFQLSSPTRLRGGLIFQTRISFRAAHTLRHPVVELSDNWFDGVTLNSIQPAPVSEARGSHGVRLLMGKLAGGKSETLYLEWSVNPTTVGGRDLTATLLDGDRVLTTIERHVIFFP